MADRTNDERLREITVIAARERARVEEIKRLRAELDAAFLELDAARKRIVELAEVRAAQGELLAHLPPSADQLVMAEMDAAVARTERDAARAEVERLRAELRAVATIAHEGGLAELGEGPPLTAIRRRTLCWWDRTGSRADAYARVRAAMKHKETDQ